VKPCANTNVKCIWDSDQYYVNCHTGVPGEPIPATSEQEAFEMIDFPIGNQRKEISDCS